MVWISSRFLPFLIRNNALASHSKSSQSFSSWLSKVLLFKAYGQTKFQRYYILQVFILLRDWVSNSEWYHFSVRHHHIQCYGKKNTCIIKGNKLSFYKIFKNYLESEVISQVKACSCLSTSTCQCCQFEVWDCYTVCCTGSWLESMSVYRCIVLQWNFV
jgi:hypothetical protein